MGTSLWLVPSQSSPAATTLQDVIGSLSKKHASPTFPPHITLASQLPARVSPAEIAACLASEMEFELSFETLCTGQTFFQSVFVEIQMTPALSNLYRHVHLALGVEPKVSQFPHISLYYGDTGKEEIARGLHLDGIVHALEPRGVSVGGLHKFTVDEVWLVTCQGMPEEWVVMGAVPLKTSV